MKAIIQKEEKILREKAKPVNVKDLGTNAFRTIIAEMKAALASQEDGVAIAAPQIGESLRIFVVSGKALARSRLKDDEEELIGDYPDLVFINPKIQKLSQKKIPLEEGCLSVRYLYGTVVRSEKATVEALDEYGKKFTRGATGLLAQIFQHEIDHLDGILFIDKARDIHEILPEKNA